MTVGKVANIALAAVFVVVACTSASSTGGDSIDTAATGTVTAEQTAEAQNSVNATVIAAIQATLLAAPTNTPDPTSTPTATPPPTPTPTAVPTPQPTATPTAVSTPTPTPVPSPTPTPTATVAPLLTLADLVEQVGPSVVKVVTDRGSGSGVAVKTLPNGKVYVLTNQHVVDIVTEIKVIVRDTVEFNAELVASDFTRDLAVLTFCCDTQIEPVPFASTVRVGDTVAALGYPLGLNTLRVSQGIISGKDFSEEASRYELQTDAALNPGNSGGPLVLLDGTIAGINTYGVEQTQNGTSVDGVNFAIAAETLVEIVPALIEGRVTPAPTSTPHPNTTDGVYTNPYYGWQVDIPPGWIIDDSEYDAVLIYNNRIGTFVLVRLIPLGTETFQGRIQDFVAVYTFGPSPEWEDFSMIAKGFINRTTATHNFPITGYEFQYRFTWNGSAFRGFTHWFLTGGFVAELVESTMILPEEVWAESYMEPYRHEIQEMFSSFKPR